jgi:hypothetical protein
VCRRGSHLEVLCGRLREYGWLREYESKPELHVFEGEEAFQQEVGCGDQQVGTSTAGSLQC